MNLANINENVNRLLDNVWSIVGFFKEYLIDPPKDVTLIFKNADGTQSTNTFPNIAKQIENSTSLSREVVATAWETGEVGIVFGSNGKYYYPNTNGDPANNDPVDKQDDTDWYGAFDTLGDTIVFGDTLLNGKIDNLPTDTGILALVDDTAPKLGGDLDFNGKSSVRSAVKQIDNATPLDGSTFTFDYTLGDVQRITAPAGGTLALAFTGFPTGAVAGCVLDIVNGGNCTISHPSGMFFEDGTPPVYTPNGTDRVVVITDKFGTLYLSVVALNMKVIS